MGLETNILTPLRERHGALAYDAYIAPLKLTHGEIEGEVLVFTAPSKFIKDAVQTRYLDEIRDLAAAAFNRPNILVRIAIAEDTAPIVVKKISPLLGDTRPSATNNLGSNTSLSTKMSFSNYVIGPHNELAVKSAAQLGKKDSVTQLLYVYGSVGLGKSHLLHAIGNANKDSKKVLYLSADSFVARLVAAIKDGKANGFKGSLNELDIILIDDFQFVAGKAHSQKELFHIFDTLLLKNKTIVVAADRAPSTLEGIDAKLVSRLQGGLTVDLRPPDLTARLAIIRQKLEYVNVVIDQDSAEYLARTFSANIRELEGAVNRLRAVSSVLQRQLSFSDVKDALLPLLGHSTKEQVTVAKIKEQVACYLKLSLSELESPKRGKTLSTARQIAMFLARKHTEASLVEIGRAFGGRDHATVLYSASSVSKAISQSSGVTLSAQINEIERLLGC